MAKDDCGIIVYLLAELKAQLKEHELSSARLNAELRDCIDSLQIEKPEADESEAGIEHSGLYERLSGIGKNSTDYPDYPGGFFCRW